LVQLYVCYDHHCIHVFLYSLVYDPFWISSIIHYATKFGAICTWVCCHISSCDVCHLKGWLISFVRWIEFIFLLWMQWQEERQQETFLKLVSATRNLHFVGRFYIWFFVYYGYMLMSIFHSTIQLVSWQNNKMWMPGACRMSNHTVRSIHFWLCFVTNHVAEWGITELVLESHLVTCILYPLHLLTFHVILFLHISTSLCTANTTRWLFLYLPTPKKLPIPCPLYIPTKHLTALSSHTYDYWTPNARYSPKFCYWQGSNY
jgi:hypothetical protein